MLKGRRRIYSMMKNCRLKPHPSRQSSLLPYALASALLCCVALVLFSLALAFRTSMRRWWTLREKRMDLRSADHNASAALTWPVSISVLGCLSPQHWVDPADFRLWRFRWFTHSRFTMTNDEPGPRRLQKDDALHACRFSSESSGFMNRMRDLPPGLKGLI